MCRHFLKVETFFNEIIKRILGILREISVFTSACVEDKLETKFEILVAVFRLFLKSSLN